MPAIVEFPSVVQDLLVQYADLFADQPERQHFAEYLTGLFIDDGEALPALPATLILQTSEQSRQLLYLLTEPIPRRPTRHFRND